MKNESESGSKKPKKKKRRKDARRSKYEEVIKVDMSFDQILALAATGAGVQKKKDQK